MSHESIRNLKIKQWLLVLLRTLIIILLVLMLAKPSTKGILSNWLGGEVDSRAIVFIDNSASMSLETDQGTLLNNAKFQAKAILRKLETQTSVEIYQTNPLKQLFTGHLDRAQSISNALNSITNSVTTDDLWEKLLLVLRTSENDENK